MSDQKLHPDTLAIHAGQPFDPRTGAVSFPIFQTSTFPQHAPGQSRGYAYARGDNPTRRALEECLASIEGARYGVAFASGLTAVNAVISTLQQGDHVIAGRDLYGGSYRLFTKVFAKFGVRFSFVDTSSLTAIAAAIEPATKLLWLETPSNPLLTITDIKPSAAAGRAACGSSSTTPSRHPSPSAPSNWAPTSSFTPPDVRVMLADKYLSAFERITGRTFPLEVGDVRARLEKNLTAAKLI